jgi:ankyrin repeat protein
MIYSAGRYYVNIQWLPSRFWRFGRYAHTESPQDMQPLTSTAYVLGPLCATCWCSDGPPPPTHPTPAPQEAALFEAVSAAEKARIRSLLGQGADANAINAYGIPVLMHAVLTPNVSIAQMLLEAGADARARIERSNITALMWAASTGDPGIVQLLLEHGADVNATETHSTAESAIHWAFKGRKTNGAVMRLLIQAGADVNGKNSYGETLLIRAAEYDLVELGRVLLAAGADPHIRARDGATALFWASKRQNREMQSMLREAGAVK